MLSLAIIGLLIMGAVRPVSTVRMLQLAAAGAALAALITLAVAIVAYRIPWYLSSIIYGAIFGWIIGAVSHWIAGIFRQYILMPGGDLTATWLFGFMLLGVLLSVRHNGSKRIQIRLPVQMPAPQSGAKGPSAIAFIYIVMIVLVVATSLYVGFANVPLMIRMPVIASLLIVFATVILIDRCYARGEAASATALLAAILFAAMAGRVTADIVQFGTMLNRVLLPQAQTNVIFAIWLYAALVFLRIAHRSGNHTIPFFEFRFRSENGSESATERP